MTTKNNRVGSCTTILTRNSQDNHGGLTVISAISKVL